MNEQGDNVAVGQRRYSQDDVNVAMAVLSANGGNLLRTALASGIPYSTIKQWRDNGYSDSKEQKERELELAQMLESIAFALVEAMPEKISEAHLNQIAVTLGISVEKTRLLRDQATAKNETVTSDNALSSMSDDDLRDTLEYVNTLRAREQGATDSVEPAETH